MDLEFPRVYELQPMQEVWTVLKEIAVDLAPGDNLVFHIYYDGGAEYYSAYYVWDLIHFEHYPKVTKPLAPPRQRHFMSGHVPYKVQHCVGKDGVERLKVTPFRSSGSSTGRAPA